MVDAQPISEQDYLAFEKHLKQLVRSAADSDDWARLDLLMHEAASAPHPYLVYAFAAGCMTNVMLDETRDKRESALASELYLVWNWIGDWYELTGEASERAEAETSLQLAANEWLALPDEVGAREAFAARWQDALQRR